MEIMNFFDLKQLKLLELEVKKRILNDPAHDYSHIMRVYKNAKLILKNENANSVLVLASVLLHDIINYPKSDPRSKHSSTKSAVLASKILCKHGFSNSDIAIICDGIRDHSFSRGKIPKTIEGKILQDADRLDALGSIGIARVFTVGGFEAILSHVYLDYLTTWKMHPLYPLSTDASIMGAVYFFHPLLNLLPLLSFSS